MITQPHQSKIVLEVSVDSVESAVASQEGGASRVELCANLNEGGITPRAGMIKLARKKISIGLHVIIRPRAGDFCYSAVEFETMKQDITLAKQLGADGVVFGILRRDNSVDIERMRKLVELAEPMDITFHRAFDLTRDPFTALEEIIELGINRLLTSGQKATAVEGLDLICELVRKSGGRIVIVPASGINEQNIAKVIECSGAGEIHVGGAVRIKQAPSQSLNADLSMGTHSVTDSRLVKMSIHAIT